MTHVSGQPEVTPEGGERRTTEFLPGDGHGTKNSWWQRRTRRQRWGIYGAGALAALFVIGSTNANDNGNDATAGAGASSTAAATDAPTSTPRPTIRATARPTARPTSKPTPTPAPALGSAPGGQTQQGTVVDVVDGDTIKVDIDGSVYTVRYIGIDTPETVHPTVPVEWMGAEASAANERLVAGKQVVLEKDVSETDQYDRLLRYVWLDNGGTWLLVNLELVRLGYANASSYPPDVAYQELLREAEAEARDASLGLWAPTPTPVPTVAPTPAPPAPTAQPAQCHPSYVGACLMIGKGDYDCAGGSGNGPNYVRGPIQVVGYDEFGLDGDGDGIGCE